jgi:hypothetical protein
MQCLSNNMRLSLQNERWTAPKMTDSIIATGTNRWRVAKDTAEATSSACVSFSALARPDISGWMGASRKRLFPIYTSIPFSGNGYPLLFRLMCRLASSTARCECSVRMGELHAAYLEKGACAHTKMLGTCERGLHKYISRPIVRVANQSTASCRISRLLYGETLPVIFSFVGTYMGRGA